MLCLSPYAVLFLLSRTERHGHRCKRSCNEYTHKRYGDRCEKRENGAENTGGGLSEGERHLFECRVFVDVCARVGELFECERIEAGAARCCREEV